MLLIPVISENASTLPGGVTIANEFNAISPYATNGLTHAQYNIAQYRHAYYVKASERQLVNNTRGNHLQAKIDQLQADFIDDIATDLYGASADSDSAMLGIQYPLATANVVGNIDQATATDWQSNVTTSAGPLDLDMIDNSMDAAMNRRGKIDLIMFSYSSTNNLWAKFRAQIPHQLYNADFSAKYGFNNIEYMGATCIMEGRLTAGVIVGLDSKSWYYAGDTTPKAHEVIRLPGTGAEEHYFDMFAGVACANPARNFRITGVS
jgi:hypothetical protein